MRTYDRTRLTRLRFPAAALCLLASCGGGGNATLDGGVAADAVPTCGTTWELVEVEATATTLLDAEPGKQGRAVRVGVTVQLNACDDLATMTVGYVLDTTNIVIGAWIWHQVGDCASDVFQTITRPFVLEDLFAGTWQVTGAGANTIDVTIEDGAPSCDTSRTECVLDCDCDEGAGERCLSYGGFAGPTTQCAVPCELDRDCGGTTCEPDIADGLGHVCSTTPECGAGRACPTNWTCEAGACTPDFTLNNTTRHVCGCDADCDPGLRCVSGFDPSAPRRCEAICQTPGAWCEGAHVCGEYVEDAAGLASIDSVCVWLGE